MYPTADDFYGFIFYCEDGDLSHSEPKSKKEVSELPSISGNKDHLYIFCNRCDTFMQFKKGNEPLFGEWVCPVCGAAVPEDQPYDILEEENRDFENWLNSDDDDF